MFWQWIGLSVFSLTLLPAGLAMAGGWAPARLRARHTPVRARSWNLAAHADLLRHTFAVLTLEQLQRGHLAALGEMNVEQRRHYVRVFGDPVDWVRRRLGHASLLTTVIYLHALEELEMEPAWRWCPTTGNTPRPPQRAG
ncbi:hypothetical protein ACWGIU_00360 [Streptomyces sp. NPDC054840]